MIRLTAIGMLVLAVQPASAQRLVLDFEDVPPSASTVTVVSTRGFVLSNAVGVYVASGPSYCTPQCPGGSGQFVIAQGFPAGPVTLERADGKEFSFAGFDFAETNTGSPYPPEIRVDGLTPAGTTVSFTVTLDGKNDGAGPLADFQRASLPSSFSVLRSVTFRSLGGGFPGHLERFNYSLDNLQVAAAVDVPTLDPVGQLMLALLLLAVSGVVLHVRAA